MVTHGEVCDGYLTTFEEDFYHAVDFAHGILTHTKCGKLAPAVSLMFV